MKKLVTIVAALMCVTCLFAAPKAKKSKKAAAGAIKVGIINNDPNESGYRAANDRDLKATFCEANGYDASFYYSLKNDEQLNAASQMITEGVDYLLLSAAGLYIF